MTCSAWSPLEVVRRLAALDDFLALLLLPAADLLELLDRFVALRFVLSAISNSPFVRDVDFCRNGLPERAGALTQSATWVGQGKPEAEGEHRDVRNADS